MSTAAEWYRRNYPEGPAHDERCLRTLVSLAPIYRLPITGYKRKDGGIRKCGEGIEVHLQGTDLATTDGDELTRLVIAAHRYRCRVSISHRGSVGVLYIHPRHDGGYWHESHPGLDDLAKRIAEQPREEQISSLREMSGLTGTSEVKREEP